MRTHRTRGRLGLRRTALILGCVLAATVVLAPSSAVAEQAATEEYDLGPLPEGTGEEGDGDGQSAPVVKSAGSDGGGPNALLIVLAAVAAVGTGIAIWQLRKQGHHHT